MPVPVMTVPGEPPASPTTAAVRATGLRKTYGRGETAVRRSPASTSPSPAASSPPSWARRVRASPRSCTAWPAWTRATAGEVWLGGTELTSLRDDELTTLRRQRIGFVFQSFNLLPVLDARQNIVLPMQLAGQRPDRAWLDAVIARLGLRERLGHRPHELSGGQQQRVAIARALLPRPDVVFADEPTGNLDSRSGAEVLGLLRSSVREDGQTVVMVTHDPTAAAYADRVVLLADGRLAGELDAPTAESVLDALAGLGA